MADYVVKGESLTAVADAIRAKTGETDALGLGEMPGKVGDVFEAGKKSEYDAFWDRVQENGERSNYGMAFCMSVFPRPAFDPKYDIRTTNAQYMFTYWNNTPVNPGYFELDLRKCGVEIDFSQSTSFQSMFQTNYQLAAIGVFDTRSATALSNTFYYAIALHTVEKLILKDDGSQKLSNTFTNCLGLENIAIEGVIGSALDIHWSNKLTHDSLMSIINALKDYVGSGTTYTCTLGTANLAKLTDAEKQIATQKGWTLA